MFLALSITAAALFAALYLRERRAHARAKADNARTTEANEGLRAERDRYRRRLVSVLAIEIGGVRVYDVWLRTEGLAFAEREPEVDNTGGGVVLPMRGRK